MPANVETMFYVGQVPWHGLGKKLDSPPTVREGMIESGLDWPVLTKPIYTKELDPLNPDYYVECKLGQVTYRGTDGEQFAVVGNGYVPYQNKDAFDWFEPFVESGEASLHTAGSLDNGKVVWVLAELNRDPIEILKDDAVARFLLLSNSHDGTRAVRVGFTPIRVVCANTLAMAHSATNVLNQYVRVRHSTQTKVKVEQLRDVMNLANQQFEATAEQYRLLAGRYYNQSDVKKFVKMVLKVENTPDDEISTRAKNQMEAIMKLVEHGLGNDTAKARGTWWAAYNGATQYLSYDYGRNSNNRLKGLWFGQQANLNQTLLDAAIALAA